MTLTIYVAVAQLGEQRSCKAKDVGSTPTSLHHFASIGQ